MRRAAGFDKVRNASLVAAALLATSSTLAQQAALHPVEDPPHEVLSQAKVSDQAGLKRGEWALLPIPQSNPTIGTGLQLLIARFFQTDADSTSSAVGVGGAAYDSGTWGAGAGGMVAFGQDRWRVSGAVGYFDARYDLFGVGIEAGDENRAVPIAQEATVAGGRILRRVGKAIYAGAGYFYLKSKVALDEEGIALPPDIAVLLERDAEVTDAGPLLAVSYDTRDANFGPRTGSYANLTAAFPSEALGGTFSYQRYFAQANHYLPVREKHTVAFGLTLCGVTEEAPFYAQCLYGAGGAPRGYVAGQYRDQAMYVAQAEWRTQVAARWGATAFAAIGQVGQHFGALEDLLPAAGVGVRFLVAPEHRVNLSADLAWNKDGETSFYLRIGEAF
jgi:hypothetical protein